ncbi:MAG: hypothetical protein ABMA15_04945 [Vicinamibacterales bacterium]
MKQTHLSWRRAGTAALCVGVAALSLASCNTAEKTGASVPAPSFTPAVSINALMVSWVDSASHVLWDVEKDGGAPKDEADWIDLEDHATQLAAAGSLIQLGGSGQADGGWVRQVGWQTHAQALTKAALADLAAAKSRNLEALLAANGDLVDACMSCHKEFKPDLPSEGISHHPSRSEAHEGH